MDYYEQGLKEAKNRHYTKAIELYLLASLDDSEHLCEIYYELAITLVKKKMYQEACEAFLLIDGSSLIRGINSGKNDLKNKKTFYTYLKNKNYLTLQNYLELGQKAESLQCWSVASYAYKSLIQRDGNFNKKSYLSLGKSLMQEEKYKEAITYFMEQKNYDESLETYAACRESLFIDAKTILYMNTSKFVFESLIIIGKDVYFDSYHHVLVVDKIDEYDSKLLKKDILLIERGGRLYKRYLAQAKYIIGSDLLPKYFKRREEQVFLVITNKSLIPIEATHFMNEKSSFTDMIQEVFFENKKNFHGLKERKNKTEDLYSLAIEEFTAKKWESCYVKFQEVKKNSLDITKRLATRYYLKEAYIQNFFENNETSLDVLIPYKNYQFSAENFVGINTLLLKASRNNSSQWKGVLSSFLPILEEMKKCDRKIIRSVIDKKFLNKVKFFSSSINKSLEATLLPYQVWFVFADLFIFAGLYKKYQLVREKALISVLAQKDISTINQKRYKLNALSESFNEEEYTLLRESLLSESSEKIKQHFQLLGSSELFFNKRKSCIEFSKEFYTEDEKQFSQYIKGKSIAIVGPIDSKLNLGKEIDKHDVVLRFNYNGIADSLHESSGSKTTISFYISEVLINNKFDKKKIEKMNELDWVIFDTSHKKNDICFLGVNTALRQRHLIAHPHLNPYFKGTANAVQRTLLDLLRFDTGKINIYNSNLFLENNYNKNYKSRGTLGSEHLIFHWHDPLGNFIFLKRLKEFNMIGADEVLDNILNMNEYEYIEALEQRYGIR